MKNLFILLFLMLPALLQAQQIITGNVYDEHGVPLIGANVFLQGTYEGTTSDTSGLFRLETDLTGMHILVIRYIGFRQFTREVVIEESEALDFTVILEPEPTEIQDIYISAGTFEAGDRKKGVVLSSYDISTTAGAMNTLPGTMNVGDEGALFVRGGDKHETRTLIDGMMVERPYTAKSTDFPVRSRFSPLLFNGTLFSTGGYSAEYGQALSSIMLLTTNSSASDDMASFAIHNVGAGLNLAKNHKNTVVTSATNYSSLGPYNKLFKPDITWDKSPSSFDQTFTLRQRTGDEGLLKLMGTYHFSTCSMFYPSYSTILTEDHIGLKNHNGFLKATFNDQLSDRWMIKSGMAFNLDNEQTGINDDLLQRKLIGSHLKLAFYGNLFPVFRLKLGGDYQFHQFRQNYMEALTAFEYKWGIKPSVFSCFAESELSVKNKLALRLGTRLENAGQLNGMVLSPRLSMAIMTGRNSQVSFSYGMFSQMPDDAFLIFSPSLKMERAQHLIANYQFMKSGRIIRTEGYLKSYSRLVTFDSLYSYMPEDYGNAGQGYAFGIDVFYRDKTTFRNGDFWISYSWIESRRKYHDYSSWKVPGYITAHNLSIVYRQFFESIKTFAGFSYAMASGRQYHDPNYSGTQELFTPFYHDLSVNFLRMINIFDKMAAIHCVINNLPGFNNVFGYRYAIHPDESGYYASMPVKSPHKRFIVVGMVILLSNPI